MANSHEATMILIESSHQIGHGNSIVPVTNIETNKKPTPKNNIVPPKVQQQPTQPANVIKNKK